MRMSVRTPLGAEILSCTVLTCEQWVFVPALGVQLRNPRLRLIGKFPLCLLRSHVARNRYAAGASQETGLVQNVNLTALRADTKLPYQSGIRGWGKQTKLKTHLLSRFVCNRAVRKLDGHAVVE